MKRAAIGLVLVISLGGVPVPAVAAPLPALPVGANPTEMVLSPDGSTLLVSNRDDDTLTLISTSSWSVLKTLPVGDEPGAIAVTPDGTKAYVATTELGTNYNVVDVVSLSSRTVVGSVPSNGPALSIAFNGAGSKAYIVSSGSVAVIDVASGTLLRYLDTAYNPKVAVTSQDGRHIFVVHGDNSVGPLYIFDSVTDTLVGGTDLGGRGAIIAQTPDLTSILAPLDGDLNVISPYGGSIPVGEAPMVAITPIGSQAYLPLPAADSVAVVDIGSQQVVDSIPVGDAPWRVRISPDGTRVYVLNHDDSTVSYFDRAESTVDPALAHRLAGTDRYSTAVEISKAGYASSDLVYVATGENYPDALSAAAAAAKDHAPLLLTPGGSLPAVVAAELERLAPTTIVVVGGTASISASVRDELAEYGNLEEISGVDRYATSRAILWERFNTGPNSVPRIFLATGLNFPDALSAGAVAGSQGIPVLLTPSTSEADNVTVDLFNNLNTTSVLAVGNAITDDYLYSLYARTNAQEHKRLAGPDRFATSQMLNSAQILSADTVYLATGFSFPDALAGAALAGAQDAPLYVVPTNCIPQRVLNDIARIAPEQVVLLGGPTTLSPAVAAMTACR